MARTGTKTNNPQHVVGKRYGHLVVTALSVGRDKYRNVVDRTLCDCGNGRDVPRTRLFRQHSPVRHCGCQAEVNRAKNVPAMIACGQWGQLNDKAREAKLARAKAAMRQVLPGRYYWQLLGERWAD